MLPTLVGIQIIRAQPQCIAVTCQCDISFEESFTGRVHYNQHVHKKWSHRSREPDFETFTS